MIIEFEIVNFYLILAIIFIVFASILFFVSIKYKEKIKFLELENLHLENSLVQNRESNEILKLEIENITSKIFDESNKKSNLNIKEILKPFENQLQSFGNRVNEVFTEETKQRTSLQVEIKNLKELNNQISNDANNLAKALKGQSKIQGDWGEMILESILNQSGLRKDIEYKTQNSYTNSEGNRLRPDVIVHLPTNKDIIIDSKLSLNSYVDYFNSEDENEKIGHITRLENSIKNHIKDLSSKKYENLDALRTLDFVLMFIPIEGAFSLLLSTNSTLFETALKSNIVLVSPTTLYSSLRVIENLWQDNRQNENAKEISKQAAELYDKFVGFLSDFEDIGKSLDRSKESYEKALIKLNGRGSLISRSQKFLELGVKPNKTISSKFLNEENR